MQGLKEFPSIVIVPMMQISWTLFSIVSGGIYFQEYSTFTALSGFMFTLGVLVGPALSAMFPHMSASSFLHILACLNK